MEQHRQLSLSVLHAGTTFSVDLDDNATVRDLRHQLEDATGVPQQSQKVISKGKALPNGSAAAGATLASLNIVNGAKLSMIGTKASTSKAAQAGLAALQQRLTASSSRQTVQPRKTGALGKTVMDMNDLSRSGANAFNSIEVLQHCPHEDLRRERLHNLIKDESVLDCMKRREWTIGLLSELHPHRDPTLLGLNKNAGEAIYLRLLTDDLSGLRSYNATRMVLLHELTHNTFGPHDEQFKALNSLLNKEVKAFEEARQAGAHRLGGDIHDAYDQSEAQVEQMCGSTGKAGNKIVASVSVTSRRPAVEEDGAWEQEQRRQAMLRAAEERRKYG